MTTQQQVWQSSDEGQKRQGFLWGHQFVPRSQGSGRLVECLVWLAETLPEGQVLHLEQPQRTLWRALPPCVAAGDVCAVAVYFTFRDSETMDLCREGLQNSLAVTADVWSKWPEACSEEWARDCSLVILFDPESPLAGPMQTQEVVCAVQHYLGYCEPTMAQREERLRIWRPTGIKDPTARSWDGACVAEIELVPEKDTDVWLASRQFLLSTAETTDRWRGWGFHCGTVCR